MRSAECGIKSEPRNGRVAQIQKHEKDGEDENVVFENSSNIANFELLRLVGVPTQPRSGVWATLPNLGCYGDFSRGKVWRESHFTEKGRVKVVWFRVWRAVSKRSTSKGLPMLLPARSSMAVSTTI